MNNTRVIKWSKWVDPLDNVVKNDDDDNTPIYRDSFEEAEIKQKSNKFVDNNIGPVIVGPFGIIPINESNQPSKVFNFWMCDTNFSISKKVKRIIDSTPGVETLDIYTKYRCRISIGRAFDEVDVQLEIEKRLLKLDKKPKEVSIPVTKLDMIKKYLNNKYKYWAIFILPDGQIDYKTGDTQDGVKKIIENYPNKADVLTSWERENNEKNKIDTQSGNERRIQSSPRG